jgi:Prolyl oligopeptidase family
MEAAFAKAAALFQPRFEPVRIPWEGGTIPGWFLGPGGKGARPTVILNNGSDAQNIDMFVYGGAASIERGWNALIIEGPGQGGNLFLRSQVFIPEWERVITPVVDFLRARPEVDKRRISLIGQSFGGLLVARAAVHERRLAALVTDTGVTDAFWSWEHDLPPSLLKLLSAGRAALRDLRQRRRIRTDVERRSLPPEPCRSRPDHAADRDHRAGTGNLLPRPAGKAPPLDRLLQHAASLHRRRGRRVPLRADGPAAAQRTGRRLARNEREGA